MSRLLLFYRLIVRPLFREPARSLLTLLAIALGVAVVLPSIWPELLQRFFSLIYRDFGGIAIWKS